MTPSEAKSENLMVAEKTLLERIAHGEPLEEILLEIVTVIEQQTSTPAFASIILLDRSNGNLRTTVSRHTPPSDPSRTAAWAIPIHGRGEQMLGTLEIRFHEIREPDEREISTANLMAGTAAIAIEKDAAAEAHRALIQETNHRKGLYEAAVANTPDLVYVFDLNHRFTYANPALLKLWGKTWEEAAGKTCLELGYEPWHAAMHDREIEEVVRTRESVKGEVPFSGSGGLRVYEYIFSPVLDSRGQVTAVSGTTRDVTDRKREEESALFLSSLSRRLSQLTCEREVMKAAAEDLGRFISAHRCYFVECLAEENRVKIGPNWLRDPDSVSLEGVLNLFDFGGEEWWEKYCSGNFVVHDVRENPLTREKAANYERVNILSYTVQPYTAGGVRTAVLGVTEDSPRDWTADELTLIESVMARTWPLIERLRVEKALRESGERLRMLWESASILLTTDDPDTMLQRLFEEISGHLEADVFFNFIVAEEGPSMALRSHHGLSPDEVARCQSIMIGEGACGQIASLQKPVIIPGMLFGEWTEALGHYGLKAYAGYPLLKDGRPVGTLAFASRTRDAFSPGELEFLETISHYVTAARIRLELLENLRRADRRKDEFLATLAHELRNPLAPIRTCIEVLKDVMDQPEKATAIIGVIERQTAQMVRLIDDLIDVSRITRGKLELRNTDCLLGEILTAATETVHPLLTARGHELIVSLPQTKLYVHGDPSRLSQVFSNLLSNAARYTPDGGKIRLSVETATEEITIIVADNGDGIESEMQDLIFEMFTQVKRVGNCPTDGGLGIGLTLVRLIVDLHGGKVHVQSEGRGKGSEFRIVLPRVAPAHPAAEIPAAPAGKRPPSSRGKVLIIDDGVSTADILSMFFDLEGFEAHTAYSGSQGLEIAREHQPDLAFIDIGMPEMDGNETARHLRQIPGCESAILIALTGWGQEEDRRKTAEAGFDHHLVKPAAPSVLREILAKLNL